MNSLRPHGLFLANQLDDVESLLGQRIPLGRNFLISSLHALSISLQSKTPILLFFNHRPFLFPVSFFSNKVVSLILSSNLLCVETTKVTPTDVDLTPV
ncbi:hypothetical protein Hanom_Chr05g00419191 [Helianthus anomalus]